jgi:membrane protein implicated in regulation of membrane protease activity
MKSEWRAFCALALAFSPLAIACGEADESGELSLTGVVLETMDGGGYTYAHVELEDTEVWVAGPVTPLKVGDTVSLVDTMAMGSFPSIALDRTFDELFFVMSFQDNEDSLGGASGIAAQVVPAGGYTYVEVEGEGNSFWLAAPDTEIPEGARVEWKGPMLMRDFHSSSLDRTFSEILFVDSVWVSG